MENFQSQQQTTENSEGPTICKCSCNFLSLNEIEEKSEILESTPYFEKVGLKNRHENNFLLCFLTLLDMFTLVQLRNMPSLDAFPKNSYHNFHSNNL